MESSPRVLLCTPIETNSDIGGIPIWAKAITNQYKSDSQGVLVDIYPMNRSDGVYKSSSIVIRILYGIKDYIRIFLGYKKGLVSNGYDIVHICSSASLSLVKDLLMIRYAKRKHVKPIMHFHFGRIPDLSKKRNWEWKLLTRVVEKSDAVITMDVQSYLSLINEGYKHICNLPNPLSNEVSSLVETLRNEVHRDLNTVLFVGHVIPTKGVYELVSAVNAIPEASLRIVGKCSDAIRDDLIRIATRDGGRWLTFVGVLSHEEVIREMLAADIFALPSYTEGFPNVILESMACGCPIVATNVGAVPEMLNANSDNPCGIVIEPQKVEPLKDAIFNLLGDLNKKKELGELAQHRVVNCYSVSNVWSNLAEIWLKII